MLVQNKCVTSTGATGERSEGLGPGLKAGDPPGSDLAAPPQPAYGEGGGYGAGLAFFRMSAMPGEESGAKFISIAESLLEYGSRYK